MSLEQQPNAPKYFDPETATPEEFTAEITRLENMAALHRVSDPEEAKDIETYIAELTELQKQRALDKAA